MNYLSNSFSLSMLPQTNTIIKTEYCVDEDIPTNIKSFIGHSDLANIISLRLGQEILTNRESLKLLFDEDTLYVAQYQGERLPEGCKILPNNASINFYKITIHKEN